MKPDKGNGVVVFIHSAHDEAFLDIISNNTKCKEIRNDITRNVN